MANGNFLASLRLKPSSYVLMCRDGAEEMNGLQAVHEELGVELETQHPERGDMDLDEESGRRCLELDQVSVETGRLQSEIAEGRTEELQHSVNTQTEEFGAEYLNEDNDQEAISGWSTTEEEQITKTVLRSINLLLKSKSSKKQLVKNLQFKLGVKETQHAVRSNLDLDEELKYPGRRSVKFNEADELLHPQISEIQLGMEPARLEDLKKS